ncbi:MAG: FliI/YscN family ATPase [Candidatus Nitrohelix vancouverensis]|uniref:FliI/YscN family ATPase n=1 Tax=Candidatus Nitrohelix vancouverensis TaxID=2705534 RepID=A0A7T0G500_9BACT|nr:MAG: FliI/YscN family ATPase [Candidatus Nitrohelix vancouverensis]
MEKTINLKKYRSYIERSDFINKSGRVNRIIGLVMEGNGPAAPVGSLCTVKPGGGRPSVEAQVVGFRDNRTLLMPLGDMFGIEPGSVIESKDNYPSLNVTEALIGRIINSQGQPLDGKGPIPMGTYYPLMGQPINPMERRRVREPLDLGVRSINGLLSCARGQRVGIMAGTGVGKSVLLGMIARNTNADVNVIALVGERGREVREFIDENLGEEGLKRSVVIVATSDESPLSRLRGALTATTVAEFFRDQGNNVMLMMDSVTRFAQAQREIGLSIGEPPATRGYTPSVFSTLSRLLERAGTSAAEGSITGLYTVLVEGDDLNEPISDAVRAILDGHIALSRDLAAHNHFPAIDVLQSVSRLMIEVVTKEHHERSMKLKDLVATYKEAEDLINIGAYTKGANPKIDVAISKMDAINQYLRQGIMETCSFEDSVNQLNAIIADVK